MYGVKCKENSFIKKTNFPNFRFVDMYTLNTHNLSTKYMNATFHHSRLMGASDIYNSVSFFCTEIFFLFLFVNIFALKVQAVGYKVKRGKEASTVNEKVEKLLDIIY